MGNTPNVSPRAVENASCFGSAPLNRKQTQTRFRNNPKTSKESSKNDKGCTFGGFEEEGR